MSNLGQLCVAKREPHFPEPYNLMWIKVQKIVDRLHVKNHKHPLCKIKYGSNDLKEKSPQHACGRTDLYLGR